MHGVKRLFAWIIPRFDRERFNVSLASLRRKDLSEETLEQFGVDVTYLSRHKFDPGTYAALRKVLAAKRADIVHMHGYGATTFGRLCARSSEDPGGAARARQSWRHAVVPEDRRSHPRPAHRSRDRRLGIDGGVHHARSADAPGTHQGRVSRRTARGICAPALRQRNRGRRARPWASPATRLPLARSRGSCHQGQLSIWSRPPRSSPRSIPVRVSSSSAKASCTPSSRPRPAHSTSVTATRVRRLSARRRGACSRPSTSSCFRHCGKARRSPHSKRSPPANRLCRPTRRIARYPHRSARRVDCSQA